MAYPASSMPLSHAPAETRVQYLKSVAGLTFVGLVIAAVVGIFSAMFIAPIAFQAGQIGVLVMVLGSFAVANWVAPRFVFGGQKWLGFGMGMVFQGVAMGSLLLAAVALGTSLGNPLGLIANAMALTAVTCGGIVAYLWSGPQELSLVKAGLSALFLPMLILMGVSFAFPSLIGGTVGVAISALFVVVSAAGLLYQMNVVLHEMSTDMKIEGAYTIAMGILILFWNLLSLLMRLSGRD
jgi:FtsH-binding integral membrane protein